MRRVSCAPCWRWITRWRTGSWGTGTIWSTCGTTPLAPRSSTSTRETARSCSRSRPWTPPRTERRSLRFERLFVVLYLWWTSMRFEFVWFLTLLSPCRWCLRPISSQGFISPSRPCSRFTLKVLNLPWGLARGENWWWIMKHLFLQNNMHSWNVHYRDRKRTVRKSFILGSFISCLF